MTVSGNSLSGLVGCFCAALVLSACGQSPDKPTDVQANSSGPTFVSLNPCLDSILVEVAQPDQILALSHYSRDPASSSMDFRQAELFAATGGTGEEIIALEPDIVLASTFIAPATKSALERAGLQVETFGSPSSVGESAEQVARLARLTGHAARADDLVRMMEQPGWQSAGLFEPAADAPEISVLLWQTGQIVPGETTLIGELLRDAGFTSHSAAMGLQQADFVSLETILADPPQLVLVAGDSIGQRHPLLQELPNTIVGLLDPTTFYCGGPSILSAKTRLAEIRAEILADRR